MPTQDPSQSLKVILENKEGKCGRKWQTSRRKQSTCQTSILENITNWEFPKKVKVGFFFKGLLYALWEDTEPEAQWDCFSGCLQVSSLRNHHLFVCGQSAPLLLNSFTNTSNGYRLVLQVLLSQGTKLNPSQHLRELIGKRQNNSIKISFPIQVTVQPCFLLLAQERGKIEKQKSFLEQEFCSKHPLHHYLTFPKSQSSQILKGIHQTSGALSDLCIVQGQAMVEIRHHYHPCVHVYARIMDACTDNENYKDSLI